MSTTDPIISVSLRRAAEVTGVSVDIIKRAIKRGDIAVRYASPGKPVIEWGELQLWIHTSPTERRSA